jgi:hypothetical protein
VKDIDFIINEKAVVCDDFEGGIRIAEFRAGGANAKAIQLSGLRP